MQRKASHGSKLSHLCRMNQPTEYRTRQVAKSLSRSLISYSAYGCWFTSSGTLLPKSGP